MENNLNPASFSFEIHFQDEKFEFHEATGTGMGEYLNVEKMDIGGDNLFKFKLPSTVHSNLVLKKGIITMNSKFLTWCKNTLESNLDVVIQTNDFTVSLVNEEGTTTICWKIYKAFPIKWGIDFFNKSENDLKIEYIEFAYSNIEKELK